MRNRFRQRSGPQRGQLTGPNPTDRGKKGSRIHLLVDRQGLPLSVGISAANLHDSQALIPLVRGIPPIRSRRGPRRRRPGNCSVTRATTTATCGDGLHPAASDTASPARASSHPDTWAGTAGSLSGPCPCCPVDGRWPRGSEWRTGGRERFWGVRAQLLKKLPIPRTSWVATCTSLDSCWEFADPGSPSMGLTCDRAKLRDVDEHLHGYLLGSLAGQSLTCVFAGQSGCGRFSILAVRGGLERVLAVLMLTQC